MGIYQKLSAIQKELIAPKGQFNDFGKYPYRSCEDIIKALKPLCDKNNCVVFMSNNLECIGDRNYVRASVTLVDLETGERLESVAHAREEESKKGMDGSQITGASSSYARKYALSGLFCIDNEKDSDATNEEVKEERRPTKKNEPSAQVTEPIQKASDILIGKAHIATVKAEMKKKNITDKTVLAYYKLEKFEDMNMAQFTDCLEMLKKTKVQ